VHRESLPASAGRCSGCSSVSGAASAMLRVSTLIARPTCREPPAQAVRKEQPISCGEPSRPARRRRCEPIGGRDGRSRRESVGLREIQQSRRPSMRVAPARPKGAAFGGARRPRTHIQAAACCGVPCTP
jgi:hypothetical protein